MNRLTIAILAVTILCSPLVNAANLKAAATLTGMTAGMAGGCSFDAKPIYAAFRDLMGRSKVGSAEKKELTDMVATATGLGLNMQSKAGSMPYPEVRTHESNDSYARACNVSKQA